jgi:large subunit ribosomal protein L7/L12
MTDINKEDLVNVLGNLSILEIIDLTRKLETKWGVKAQPVVSQVAPQQTTTETVVEQTEFDVILASVPADKKMAVIKAIREIVSLGLKESKDLVEAAPKTIKEGISKEDAEQIKVKLTAAGAVIEIK